MGKRDNMKLYNSKTGTLTLRELKDYLSTLPEEILDDGEVFIEEGMYHSFACASLIPCNANNLLLSAYCWDENVHP